MNFLALFLMLCGALVGVVYGLESILFIRANGLGLPLLPKLGLCALGIYFFVRNFKRLKQPRSEAGGGEA